MKEDQGLHQGEAALLEDAVALQLRLSQIVGECLLALGWLLDREELFERSLARLRFQEALGGGDDQLEKVVQETARSMVQDARSTKSVPPSRERFLRQLAEGFGLTVNEVGGAQSRFHSLPLEDRQALLLLLMDAQGEPACKLYQGARRALLALFGMKNLREGPKS